MRAPFSAGPRPPQSCPSHHFQPPFPPCCQTSIWNPLRPLIDAYLPCPRLPYAGYFGGVSGLNKSQFLRINGFPNEYWGWGGEDDDIFNR